VAAQFLRGFKAEAERIALEIRGELQLGAHYRLEPGALAEHLLVPVLTLTDLRARAPEHVRHLMSAGRRTFSAATIHVAKFKRVIIVNPAHAPARQMSSLCHEVSHILLDHTAEGPLGAAGAREWDGEQEREADWLAGCFLVPLEAAHAAARAGHTDDDVARAFGVSRTLAAWRMNATGARIRMRRRQAMAL
jgi:Zn-dependent peptidase ImmA (M78 family)